ncbi:insulin gene enhancer protein ISL-2B-like [Clytia hemisphaerica]|uniref:Uncharacterized protein n=1 Tax=Clytia hemisphaerica TaxID=252671 RepID=A0A7M5X263_9CNID
MSLSRFANDADLRRAESIDEKTINRLELCKIHTCQRCGKSITDEFILRLSTSSEWHTQCLNCENCGDNLSFLDSCYVRNGRPYCKQDYQRMFGKTCSGCNVKLNENDFVMKIKSHVFHPECFRCIICNVILTSGDSFRFNLNGIVCKQHFDAFQGKLNEDMKDPSIFDDDSNNFDHQQQPIKNGADKMKHENGVRKENVGEHNGKSTVDACANETYKPTRIRTVLTDKQVAILKTCYTANPRPDALMKEQLVEMTGLSLRVIRVWFQNKRCKDKKKSVTITAKRKFVNSYDTVTLSTAAAANSSPYLPKRTENQILNNQWASVANQTYSRHGTIQNGSYQSYLINNGGLDNGWYEKESGLQNMQHQTPSPSYSTHEELDLATKTSSSLKPSEFFQLINLPNSSAEISKKHSPTFNANTPGDTSLYKSKQSAHSHISELGWSESEDDHTTHSRPTATSGSGFYTPFQTIA